MPTPPLLLISPLFPPGHGGLPDHTDRLAHELARHAPVTVLTSPGREERTAFTVRDVVRDWHHARGLAAEVQAASPKGPVIWQYVPHMYGRGGVNLALPRALRALRAAGRRQVVIAHEIAAPFSAWPHRSGYALAHRWMWRGMRQAADAIGISTAAWLDRERRCWPAAADRMFLSPSPSNIPLVPAPADHRTAWRRAQSWPPEVPVMAYFGTVSGAKQFGWVLAAWRAARGAGGDVALLVLGGQPVAALSDAERSRFLAPGYRPAIEVSLALQAVDLLLLPFVDGVSERRSSFMAGLAHGCAILTTHGPATGAALREGGGHEGAAADDPAEFAARAARLMADRSRRAALSDAARQAYATRYDWPVVAAAILGAAAEPASTGR